MQPLKLNLYIAKFSYGGNSGYPFTSAAVSDWLDGLLPELSKDERIGEIRSTSISETPADYARNIAVQRARDAKADIILMIDSDSQPDMYLGKDPSAVPYWDAAFNKLYEHYSIGPVVIGAPYCGPPPHENVFVIRWANLQSDHPNIDCQLQQYTREEAALMTGVVECAALPTGLILYDMRCFELTEPKLNVEETIERLWAYWCNRYYEAESMSRDDAQLFIRGIVDHAVREKIRQERPWFYYEYKDETCAKKVSTEDITNTRDISMAVAMKYGYNPCFCTWDSWCGHLKSKVVGKPMPLTANEVAEKYARQARESGLYREQRMMEVKCGPR